MELFGAVVREGVVAAIGATLLVLLAMNAVRGALGRREDRQWRTWRAAVVPLWSAEESPGPAGRSSR